MTNRTGARYDDGYVSWGSLTSTPDERHVKTRQPWSSTSFRVATSTPNQSHMVYEMTSFGKQQPSVVSGERTGGEYVQLTTFQTSSPRKSPRSPITPPERSKREVVLKPDVNTPHTVKVGQPAILHAQVGRVKVGMARPLRTESLPKLRTPESAAVTSVGAAPEATTSPIDVRKYQLVSGTSPAVAAGGGSVPMEAVSVTVNKPVLLTLNPGSQADDVPAPAAANLPKQRSSITINVEAEPMQVYKPPPPPVLTRTFSYSAKTGKATPLLTDDQKQSALTSDVKHTDGRPSGAKHTVRLFSHSSSVSRDDSSQEKKPPVTSPKRYSSWKKEKRYRYSITTTTTSSPVQRSAFWHQFDSLSHDVHKAVSGLDGVTAPDDYANDDVFLYLTPVRSRSAPQSPTSSPPSSPTLRRRRARSQSVSYRRRRRRRSRHMSSPDKLDYYNLCWQEIRDLEKKRDEEFW